MRNAIRFIALGLSLALAACNSEGTGPNDETPDPQLDRDVAIQTGEAAAQDIELMGASGGTLGIALAVGPMDRHWPFRCGTIELPNFSLTRTCTFKDAAGNTQTAYHAETTESATIHVEFAASISRPNWSAEVERTRDLTISGLAGNEETRTWNGSGEFSASRERHNDEGESREYSISGNWTIDKVVVPAPRSEDNWPKSGTVSSEVTVSIVGGPHDGKVRTREVTLTFNGTRLVPIVVNGTTFIFDLRARRIVRSET